VIPMKKFDVSIFGLVGLFAFPSFIGDLQAQEAEFADPWAGVEEMVVVGASSLLGTSMATSAVAFDAETLRAEGITDVEGLANFTPNLEIKTAFAASNPTIFIRGVGLDDFNANAPSSVAVYQDGVYMNSPAGQLFQFFDIQGIEVLRGPQGTLRNASAGAIRVVTNKPSDDFEAEFTTTYGRFNQTDIEGAVTIPIYPELLSWRGAFKVSRRGGTTENRCNDLVKNASPAARSPCGQAVGQDISDHVNNTSNWAARSLLASEFSVGDWETAWLLNIHGAENDSDATQFQHNGWQAIPGTGGKLRRGVDQFNYRDTDGDPFAGDYDFEGLERLSLFGSSLTAIVDFGNGLKIKSITGYEWHDRKTAENSDANPRRWLETISTDDAWQLSQETQLRWEWSDTGEMLLGGMFLREDLDSQNFFINRRGVGTTFDQTYIQNSTAYSGYGEIRWSPPELSRWSAFLTNIDLDAGVRFNWEEKEFGVASDIIITNGGSATSKDPEFVTDSWNGWSGYASLTYNVTEEHSLYAKYSRGLKPGHFNGGTLFNTTLVTSVKPEQVDALELGLNASWFDGRLEIYLAYFLYDYQNLQVFLLKQDSRGFLIPSLVNSRKADVQGVEIELDFEPIEGLAVSFTGAWLDSRYTDFKTSFDRVEGFRPVRIVSVEVDFSGNRLVASPLWSLSGSIEYMFEIEGIGTLRSRLSYSWKADIFFDPNAGAGQQNRLPEGTLGQEAFWLLNAALTWESPDEKIEVSGWVRNFLDEAYKVQSFDLTTPFRLTTDVYGEPRTYGLTATFRY